jgi:putative transposase
VRSEFRKISLRQACLIFNLSTSVYRYTAKKKQDDEVIHQELISLAEKRPTWGFWKMYHRIRLDGWRINHKRVYRLYLEARLNMRRKTRKRVAKRIKQPLLQPLQPNLSWSMDFMRDSLFMGRPFRAFNVIDDYNREALNITLAKSITSKKVIEELEKLIQWRGKPERIRVDNGPEFIADALREWCDNKNQNIELVFIQKGKPSQNGYIERFNKTYREDVLDSYLFEDIEFARELTNEWIWTYNNERPHESLNNLTPRLFLLKYGKLHNPQIRDEFPTFQQDNINKSKRNSIFECS